jgi:hypothetical protein
MNAGIKLSAAGEAVMAKVREAKPTPTRLAPLPLTGAERRTASQLVTIGLLREGTGGFWLPTAGEPPTQTRVRKWSVSEGHLIDPDGSEQLDLRGREKFAAKIAAGLNLLDKLPRTTP